MSASRVWRARGALDEGGRVVDGAGVRVADGRVVEFVARPPRDATDLGDVLLTPPLVNAHAHLELTDFAGEMPRDAGFGGWVRALMERRARATPEELEAAARRGARLLLESGCGVVHDVDTTGAAARALRDVPIDAVVYREAIDAGEAARRDAVLAELERPLFDERGAGAGAGAGAGGGAGDGGGGARRTEGLSPHAPYTCSPALLRALGDLARRRGLPLTIHWAETEEERRYLQGGTGPLADLLPPSPRRSGLDLLDEAGLLAGDLRLTLVHGNHPEPGDYERLARAGVPLVHCPGTHAFFGRAPFDVAAARRAGVRVLLGTDSAASNDRFDMTAELRRFAAHPDVTPAEAWRAAAAPTWAGARHVAAWDASGALPAVADLATEERAVRGVDLAGGAGEGLCRYPVDG